MAWTSVGFDGTITEIQWAGLAGLLGNGYVAAGNGDCLVTAVGGARQVSVAAGSLYGDGVLSTNSGAETVALTTPTNGQWYVVALRRTWANNTAALVAIAGATTTTTTPTVAPTSFPTLNTNVGVLTDQPIAWAWCNSANTTVVVYDIRLKAVKSLPPVVATSVERDAKFMSPTQGLQVFRNDLGAVETYYGLYDSGTNPGGRTTAGWYQEAAGRIVQVKSMNKTDVFSSTSSSYVDVTGFSLSITPKSATNKILVIVTALLGANGSGDAFVQLVRDSTTIPSSNAIGYTDSQNIYLPNPINGSVLDSPATTSSVTYKIQGKNNAGNTWRINSRGADTGYVGTSSLTLIEVTA